MILQANKITRKSMVIVSMISLSCVMSGCSITGFGTSADDLDHTGSRASYEASRPLEEIVDPSDWDKVREVVQSVMISQPSGAKLLWENEITGANGTLTAMGLVSEEDGQLCRKFSTTINSIGGIEKYRGNACKSPNGSLVLRGLAAHQETVDISVKALPKLQ